MAVTEELQKIYDSQKLSQEVIAIVATIQRAWVGVVQANMAINTLTAKDVLKEYDPALAEAVQMASAALTACQDALQGAKALDLMTWSPTVAALPVEPES